MNNVYVPEFWVEDCTHRSCTNRVVQGCSKMTTKMFIKIQCCKEKRANWNPIEEHASCLRYVLAIKQSKSWDKWRSQSKNMGRYQKVKQKKNLNTKKLDWERDCLRKYFYFKEKTISWPLILLVRNKSTVFFRLNHSFLISVSDPPHFDADPDPDPLPV